MHCRKRERCAERRERPRDARSLPVADGLAEEEPRLRCGPGGEERDDERRADLGTEEPARREEHRERVALHEPRTDRRARHVRCRVHGLRINADELVKTARVDRRVERSVRELLGA